MKMLNRTRRAQSLTEYAIVFSIVAAAVIGMQIFVKRGIQAKQHDVTNYFTGVTGDSLGNESTRVLDTAIQYEPYYAQSDYTVEQARKDQEALASGGVWSRTGVEEKTIRAADGFTRQAVDFTKDDAWEGSAPVN